MAADPMNDAVGHRQSPPRPLADFLVDKNGSKRRDKCSGAMPEPASLIFATACTVALDLERRADSDCDSPRHRPPIQSACVDREIDHRLVQVDAVDAHRRQARD